MKTTSVENLRKASTTQGRPIAQSIRDAMAFYPPERLEQRTPLRDVPTVVGRRPLTGLPDRDELYDEMFRGADS